MSHDNPEENLDKTKGCIKNHVFLMNAIEGLFVSHRLPSHSPEPLMKTFKRQGRLGMEFLKQQKKRNLDFCNCL